ncbi:fimbria/pilus periplasmic chaperone [Thiotrichales bacterium 19S3-7]|nr:fimbria/pilus periplasmic chaperone [Thiotrichales bacterium 19S3-7]MCF6802460.1 fimbria/pilus periplasmic chaperone [Thiotrichales bacterium 19S3-11]
MQRKSMILYMLIVMLVCLNPLALAGTFSILPVKLVGKPSEKVLNVKVTNKSNDNISVQLQVKRWQLKNNENVYVNTSDLLPTPAVVTLEPNKPQYIRIGVMKPNLTDMTESYRLYIRQLPSVVTANKSSHENKNETAKIQILLNISMPVFLLPKTKLTEDFSWQYKKDKDNYNLTLINNGNGVLKVTDIELKGADDKSYYINKGVYVLPKSQFVWNVDSKLTPDSITATINEKEVSEKLN